MANQNGPDSPEDSAKSYDLQAQHEFIKLAQQSLNDAKVTYFARADVTARRSGTPCEVYYNSVSA